MSAYREPAGADDVRHCLGLAYAGTRALDAREVEIVAARVAGRTWQMVALTIGVPGGSFAALMAASRMGASVTIAAGAVSFGCTVAAWTLAIERFRAAARARRYATVRRRTGGGAWRPPPCAPSYAPNPLSRAR